MLMYLGTQDGVVRLQDKDGDWQVKHRSLEGHDVWVIASQPDDPNVIYAGTYGNGLFRSIDNGAHWEQLGSELALDYVRAIACTPTDPKLIYVGTEPANLFRSTDGGDTWTDLDIRSLPGAEDWFLPYSPRAGAVRTLALHPNAPSLIYGGVEQGGVLKSTDGGESWTITYDGVHPDVHSLAIDPHDPQVLFAATGGGVYRTRDGGQTWERLIDDYTRAVTIHPLDPNVIFAGPARQVGHIGRILGSQDRGDTWVLAAEGLPIPMLDMVESYVLHPHYPDTIFAILSDGDLLYSRTDQIVWRPFEPQVGGVHSLALVREA